MAATEPSAAQTALEAAAAHALKAWEVLPQAIRLVSHSENVAFRVDAMDGQRYVLRLHRPGYHTRAELESEHIFTAALAAAGISTPQARRTRDGSLYAHTWVAPLVQQREAGLLHWVDGQLMRNVVANATAEAVAGNYRQLGLLCAHLHDVADTWTPPAQFQRHRLDADGLMGTAPFWGAFWQHPQLATADRRRFTAARATLHRRLLDLGTAAGFSLIHADLHPGNVVLTEGGVHVIDFDDTGFGWHAYDLAVALFEHAGEAQCAALQTELLTGYRSRRPLPGNIAELLELFSAVRGLATIGWLMQRPEIKVRHFDQRVQLVHTLLDAVPGT